jgi:DeoR/GlpR family transcriptional regulator of sugar metabolism
MTQDLPLGRRDAIADRLTRGQAVVAAELALEFDVSEDAIRRDLRALAAEGRCRRVYGGALPLAVAARPVSRRLDEARPAKTALGRAAAAVVAPGDLVFLDAGSTNVALVAALPDDLDLTIVTNAVDIAAAVSRRTDLKLIVIGGAIDPFVGGAVDGEAVAAVGRMRFDRVFLGACAVAAEGVSVHRFEDATFKRALVAGGRDVVVLATSDKLGMLAPHRVADLAGVRLVVEADAPAADLAPIAEAGAVIIAAEPPVSV